MMCNLLFDKLHNIYNTCNNEIEFLIENVLNLQNDFQIARFKY